MIVSTDGPIYRSNGERLPDVTYKPGSDTFWEQSTDGIILFKIAMEVPDVDHPSLRTRISQTTMLDDHIESRYLNHFIQTCLRRIEMHEVDEWANVNGVRISDPHDAS